ncbi:MAG TPA: diacylglycerol kinase family protein [Gemmatimonadaceae bacterium]|nr:diacylglycerol kinase family protein [Gemmatimonadaceae bacterium]
MSQGPRADTAPPTGSRPRARPRRVLLVVNPASRRGGRVWRAALAALREEGVECELLLTARPGEGGAAAVERHGDFDALFTLGGDGTAMEVVGALAGTGRPVGILAGGTGNLIARTLGIPLGVRRAVRALLDGAEAAVDLGRLTGPSLLPGAPARFAFAAGVGVDSAMIERTPAALKRRIGVVAYVLSAARAVLRRTTFRVTATVDGTTHEVRGASAVMVANFGSVLNHLITLGPDIRQDDGFLDLCVFSPGTLVDAARVMWRLLRRDFRPTPHLLYVRGRRFRVETDPPLVAQADGELIGPTPFEVEVEPAAATLLVPRTRNG